MLVGGFVCLGIFKVRLFRKKKRKREKEEQKITVEFNFFGETSLFLILETGV